MWNLGRYSNFNKDYEITENFKYHQNMLKRIKTSSKPMINNNEPLKPKFLDFPLKFREYNISNAYQPF